MRTWLVRIGFLAVVACGIASAIASPYTVVRPGRAIDATALIAEPARGNGPRILIPSVDQHRAKWIEYLWYSLRGNATLERHSTTERRTRHAIRDQGRVTAEQLFVDSTDIALLVAARIQGTRYEQRGAGVRIRSVGRDYDGSFASGDVVVGWAGSEVTTIDELERAIEVSVRDSTRASASDIDVDLESGRVVNVAPPDEALLGLGAQTVAAALGVNSVQEEQPEITVSGFAWESMPEAVEGNSSGLALALAAIAAIGVDVDFGNGVIYATGEIDTDGSVYPVGGIAEKASAARADGADVLLVPSDQVDEAKRHAGPLRVVGVDGVASAVAELTKRPS